jgi:D-arabinose 1-dehydrogenase-like Zn-dependent alcohol dehydrogenase
LRLLTTRKIDIRPISQACERMLKSDVKYRSVIDVAKTK